MAGISRVCTGASNTPGIFQYTHFLPLMRRTISLRISWAQRVQERFHPEVVAIGLYGSLAREEDGPYSDIELFGVLRTDHFEQRYEWCTPAWKAEVDLYGKQTLRERAARVDERWPLTHSALQTVLALYDPEQFFAEIRTVVQKHECWFASPTRR